MKYTKTAAALALAGMTAAPLAQAEPVVTLSGGIGINLGSTDEEGAVWAFSGDDSVLNISATDTLSNGLEGYGNLRLDSALTGGAAAGDNVYIGVKGDFGDIRIGEVPDALEYGQMASDTLVDIGGENAGMSYTGAFGGATVGANWSPGGNTDKFSVGAKFNLGGFGIGAGFGAVDVADDGEGNQTRFSLGASFGLAGYSAAVAFKSFGEFTTETAASTDDAGVITAATSTVTDAVESISAKLSGSVGDIGFGLTYASYLGDDANGTNLRLDASYGLGGGWGTSARLNVADPAVDGEDAVTSYRVQFSKSF